MTTNTREEPLYSRVYDGDSDMVEEGEASLSFGWIEGPQGCQKQKRLSIYIDLPKDDSKPIEVYAIRCGPGPGSSNHDIKTSDDLKTVLDEYFSAKVEE